MLVMLPIGTTFELVYKHIITLSSSISDQLTPTIPGMLEIPKLKQVII